MTPEKRALVRAFVENKKMAEAVCEVLTHSISPEGVAGFIRTLDRSLPDHEYGQRVKTRAEAAALLLEGFAHLSRIASSEDRVQSRQNEAR